MLAFPQTPAPSGTRLSLVNALRIGVLAGAARLDTAVGHQVADESAGGLELLPRFGRRRIDQVLAQNVALGPFLFLSTQPRRSSRRSIVGSTSIFSK